MRRKIHAAVMQSHVCVHDTFEKTRCVFGSRGLMTAVSFLIKERYVEVASRVSVYIT